MTTVFCVQLLALAALANTMVVPRTIAQETRSDTGDTFVWNGTIAPGHWLRVRNLNGDVDVGAAAGNEVHVRGVKHWRHGDPSRVRFEVVKTGEDVTICALWHDDDRCDERGYHSHGHHDEDDDTSVRFTVQLPKGVKVDAGTVNGSVGVRDVSSEVVAESVNGRVDAATNGGPVNATTVNGSVNARMADAGSGDLEFSTVNGSVTVDLPPTVDADVELSTVNGSLRSDYPLTITGRVDPRHIRATIGKGGRKLRASTVNGSVELNKRS